MKSRIQDNDREMYLTHNKGKSVVAENFIRILKNKIYKYMNATCILDDIVNNCNNKYHSTIKWPYKYKLIY